eukprot:1051601-Amphidinium_carterae.1
MTANVKLRPVFLGTRTAVLDCVCTSHTVGLSAQPAHGACLLALVGHQEHSIAVSYIAADNVAELYFGSQRVEVLRTSSNSCLAFHGIETF